MSPSHRKHLRKYAFTLASLGLMLWQPYINTGVQQAQHHAQTAFGAVHGQVKQVADFIKPFLDDVSFATEDDDDDLGSRPPVRVTLWDQRWDSHDEVMAPLIYSLSNIASVDLQIYRNKFREGFYDLVRPYFGGQYSAARYVLKNRRVLDETDVLVISTAQKNLPDLLQHFDLLNSVTHIRIVAVVHDTSKWQYEPLEEVSVPPPPQRRGYHWIKKLTQEEIVNIVARLHAMGRLSFLTLSPHVVHHFDRVLREWPVFANATNISIKHFVPVLPYVGEGRKPREGLTKAVIQGELAYRARAYDRIFETLRRELQEDPRRYGYEASPANSSIWRRMSVEDPFKLDLVGSNAPKRDYLAIPEDLQDVITMSKRLSYPEYYQRIGEADILIPAFANLPLYTEIKASSSIPTAVMTRVPCLLSKEEAAAYEFLEGPALVLREDDEDEFQAISRLRTSKQAIWSSDDEWLTFEHKLRDANEHILLQLLYN